MAPSLLILDEPVAGVDQPSQEAFAATLTELTRDGMTVLVVLHELGALAPLIQRCVVLRHGLVVHDGEPPQATAAHAGPDHEHLHPHDDEHGAPAGIDMGLTDAPLTHHTPTPARVDRGAAS